MEKHIKPKTSEKQVRGGTNNNILSNVAPPIALPSFIVPSQVEEEIKNKDHPNVERKATEIDVETEQEKFNPTIPAELGKAMQSIRVSEGSLAQTPTSIVSTEVLDDAPMGSSLFQWMKGAMTNSGDILQKVAEKARSSVDTIVTTLDPQMKEYLGGEAEMCLVVTTIESEILDPVKKAFQSIFGGINLIGIECESEMNEIEPKNANAALAIAKQKTAYARNLRADFTNHTPLLTVQSFVMQFVDNRWYSLELLVLSQSSINIELHQYSQPTAVPKSVIDALIANTPEDFEYSSVGFPQKVDQLMSELLKTESSHWQETTTGVTKADKLHSAAKALAVSYKNARNLLYEY